MGEQAGAGSRAEYRLGHPGQSVGKMFSRSAGWKPRVRRLAGEPQWGWRSFARGGIEWREVLLANRAQRGLDRCWKAGVKPSDALRGHASQHPEFDEQQCQAEHRHAAGAAAEECQR